MTVPLPAWLFDDSPIPDPLGWGERAVQFIKALKHPKSEMKDRAFPLYPWQERLVRKIYGPVKYTQAGTPIRQYSTVYLQIGRGGRKTTLAAALSALHTLGYESRPKGENIVAAHDTEQARRAYKELIDICEATPWIGLDKNKVHQQDYKNLLTHIKSGSFFQAISSETGAQHGRTPIFAFVDEIHAHKYVNGETLYDVVRTGVNKTPGSLMFIATTAGRGDKGPDYPIYDLAARIQSGLVQSDNFLPVIFEAPADCDWRDEKVWEKYNPGMKYGFPSLDGLRDYAEEVASSPAKVEVFKQLHLGIRASHSNSPFVDMVDYDACSRPVDLDAHKEFKDPCWVAVDIGVDKDLTAVVACWPDRQGGADIWGWFPMPRDNIHHRSNVDKVPYKQWADEEYMLETPGNVTSDPHVIQLLRDICRDYNVQEIAFDKAYARSIYQTLEDEGYPVLIMPQDYTVMGPATKEFHRLIVGGGLSHGGHPVIRWCVGNIRTIVDRNENVLFHKGKSTDRIDGAVAAAMAIGRAFENERPEVEPTPFWAEEGFDPLDSLGIRSEDGEESFDAEAEEAMQAEIRDMLGIQ
jgi:phage terminase large subunit-like protein